MILGIDPKIDYAFKLLLGRDETTPLLIDVLNAVLNRGEGERVESVELLNPFNPKAAFDDKLSIVDIRARDQAGRLFNVEMQMLGEDCFASRVIYYAARTYQQQLREGEGYDLLRPTISICFLNHVMFPGLADYHLCFRLLETRHGIALGDDLEFHFLELPKFQKGEEELGASLEVWLYFLRHAEKMDKDNLAPVLRDSLVIRALEDLEMIAQNEQERARYESRRIARMDYDYGIKTAERRGEKIGRVEVINFCERLLKRAESPRENLLAMPLEDLTRMANDLQAQVEATR